MKNGQEQEKILDNGNILRKQNLLYESYLETVLNKVSDEDGQN